MNIFKKILILALGLGLVSVPSTLDKVEAAAPTPNLNNTVRFYVDYPDFWGGITNRRIHYWFADGENGTTWDDSYTENALSSSESNEFVAPNVSYSSWYIDMTGNSSSSLGGIIPMFKQNGTLWRPGNNSGETNIEKDSDGNAFGFGRVYKLSNINSNINYVSENGTKYYSSTVSHVANFIDLNANGGTINGKPSITIELGVNETTSIYAPEHETKIFKGWKLAGADDSTANTNISSVEPCLYEAVWEEKTADDCVVTVNVAGNTYTVNSKVGTLVSDVLADETLKSQIDANNIIPVEWNIDESSTLNGATQTIIATKYYTVFDKLKGQLAFNYNYTSTLVAFEGFASTQNTITCTAKIKNTEDTQDFQLNYVETKSDYKNLYIGNIPMKYNVLEFKWESYSLSVDRDYYKNAIWCNYPNEDKFGYYNYTGEYNDFSINSVSNVSLRVSTPDDLSLDGYNGVDKYKIKFTSGEKEKEYSWTTTEAETAALDLGVIMSEIPETNWTDTFTVSASVVIDNVEYTITKEARQLSVKSLASAYASMKDLDGVQQQACNYIVAKAA